jgi:hypothetical protein
MSFWNGTEGDYKKLSTLTKEQEAIQSQGVKAANGANQAASEYYRNNLSNNPKDYDAFAAPQLRQFNEETIPDLAEQFAGMGAGGLSSSSFRNAAVNAGTDLHERLGAIRADLRQRSAQGLQDIHNQALKPVTENIYEAGTPGAAQTVVPALATAAATAVGGPIAGAAVNYGTNALMNSNRKTNSFGADKIGRNSSPYGNQPQQNFQLPNFNSNLRR